MSNEFRSDLVIRAALQKWKLGPYMAHQSGMESHPSKCGVMEEEDRLSSLPDDLLHSILRGLQLKHAARTSALSRRWAPVWLRALASSPSLDFTDRDFVRGQTPARAAATVERCLRLHAEHNAPLDAFRVALDGTLGGGAAFWRNVVGWVADAVARGAREVEVDLTQPQAKPAHLDADQGSAAFFELPGDLFLTENSLTRLSLDRFGLSTVLPGAPGLARLRTLSLSRTDVTNEAVQAIVSNCRLLESLSLRSCHLLTSVRIAGGNLRRLELARCPAVRELRVAAPALESFAFHGVIVYMSDDEDAEHVAAVDLGATPALRDAYLSHLGFASEDVDTDKEFAYSDFLSCVAHARTLTLCSVGLQHMWAQLGYNYLNIDMTNVQELQLLMASLGNDDLQALSSVFQFIELPLLDRLFVRLPHKLSIAAVESGVTATGEVNDGDIDIYGDDFVLGHLRFIKVLNFRGTRLELVLLSFLLKRAPVLEQLVLVPADKGAPGDEQLKIIQEQVSVMRKASPEMRVAVCLPSEDRSSHNPAHTRIYHEE